jgi:hypothetical protein
MGCNYNNISTYIYFKVGKSFVADVGRNELKLVADERNAYKIKIHSMFEDMEHVMHIIQTLRKHGVEPDIVRKRVEEMVRYRDMQIDINHKGLPELIEKDED